MALVRDFFVWLILSFHVVGGAILFRRLFPRESPWFGFLVPALALPLLLNFIEHFLALPSLLWLLPITTGGLLYIIFRGGYSWEGLRLPIIVFLLAFAFTFGVRCLSPDITPGSDGLTDLSVTLNYCHGEKIPPTDNWLPTMDYPWYYSFQHYSASVIKRLLNVDGGTAVNASIALLSAFTAFAGAAIAYRVSGEKAWIALIMLVLIEAAFTGSSAYIYLTMHDPGDWMANSLSGSYQYRNGNPIWHILGYDTALYSPDSPPQRLELQVLGFWTWRDEYHANSSGHFFTLFSAFTIIELLRREKSNWPWICAVVIPPLVVITSLWLVLVDSCLCLGGLVLALSTQRRPSSASFVAYGIFAGLIALWPALSELTTAPQAMGFIWNPWDMHTPFWEFVIQWWPVIALWLVACFYWRELPLSLRWMHLAIPLMLVVIEFVSIDDGGRYNTIEKMWGPIYDLGLVCFFPLALVNRSIVSRVLAVILIFCAVVSISCRTHNLVKWIPWGHGAFNLQGDGYLLADKQKARILQVLSQLRGATVLTGQCSYNFYECPAAAVFTGNRSYIAWFFSEEHFGHGIESGVRTDRNNDFYAGKSSDPLGFLTANAIDAVIIWPGDKIPDDLVAKLKTQLAPTYQYEDCRLDGSGNAGVFLRRPLPVIQR